jgi:single-strand DNA-binding protein
MEGGINMAYLNKVILIGNVGKDPETGSTPSGASFSKFSLATSRKYKGSDELLHEQTDWHNVVCWGKLADVCAQLVKKGNQLCVEGAITYRSWDDRTTGQKRYTTEIIANNIQLLGTRPQQQNAQPAQNKQTQPSDDDLPF